MEKFLKALKNYYIVFSICVVSVVIAGGVFAVRLYNEQKLKETALAPPPVYVKPVTENITVKKQTEKPIEKKNASNKDNAVATMSIPPKNGFRISMPTDSDEIIKEFSKDKLLYSETFDDYRIHKGVDIKCNRSEAVFSAADGVVEEVYTDPLEGITIVINHNNGYKSIYKNLSSDKMIKKGETVTKGQVISGVGETAIFEAKDENHLHFELVKDDEYVNPVDFFE